mmetsp:Transcript_21211/g.30360  ORF Transcript_21211/g.30360 Transcript_21211/m.30360 type:complete len:399 (-) Transcript_21211:78-1274(-)|eukprot:CAMPEP_0201688938 /NCGR_PEP_ID=MMETSP0578-20130828/2605_1 /ASSEMBLY_ACC=CAM_ASM_000663 /TAXON_ID=267565 /ORGANISM="Skeletonema grethea, Strain CCMP 1804" /LENGTH=398 /DNA_ID=CAMNT_0048173421 /DNA_START=73 /DNA_END=1269 /DNA_ORIENTATION=-
MQQSTLNRCSNNDLQSVDTATTSGRTTPTKVGPDEQTPLPPPIEKLVIPLPSTKPWYIRGGMHVNEIGMGINITVPLVYLSMTAGSQSYLTQLTQMPITQLALYVLIAQIILAAIEGKRTLFCLVVVPVYLTCLFIIPSTLTSNVMSTLGVALFVGLWRTGICMSVCLHRYAAHAAFKCGPLMQYFFNIVGCLANQGGPIWWASQHRLHHKHCDMPRDPHSAILDGVEKAFAFFTFHNTVVEEFAPKHNDTKGLRLLDTWSFSFVSMELYASYFLFGREGLFITYTSLWICQCGTLWFNIGNHPPNAHPDKACQSTNYDFVTGHGIPLGLYPGFWVINAIYPLFASVVAESNHDDHHNHSMLAKREKYDCMYYAFLWPMEKLGLIWNVHKCDENQKSD